LAAVETMLADGQRQAEAQYRRFVSRGEVRDLPWPVAHSLMLGPAYNYMRLVGRGATATQTAPALFADAAWDAVKA
jgi:hypothetical protein